MGGVSHQQQKIRSFLRSIKTCITGGEEQQQQQKKKKIRLCQTCITGGEKQQQKKKKKKKKIRLCKTCNIGFKTRRARREHYETSGWHYFNQKRKEAGDPPLKEADFLATPSPLLYVCHPCAKGFRCSEDHLLHLESTAHAERVAPPPEVDDGIHVL